MAEYLPGAHTILWFMAGFLALWGVSLVWRGWRARRTAGARRCPACGDAVPAGMTCAACGFVADQEDELRARSRDWWLIGSGLLVQVFTAAAAYFGAWTQALTTRGSWQNSFDEAPMTPWAAAGCGVLLFGALVAFFGYRGERSRGRRRCPKCWYDLAGTVADATVTCPECGRISSLRALYRPRRRWRAAAGGLLIMLASYGLFVVPRVRTGGWVGAVPTWVMIAGIEWIPDSMFEGGVKGAQRDLSLHGRHPRRTWGWQNWLIQRWARGVAASDHASPLALARALGFLNLEARSESNVHLSIVRALTSESDERRTAAARCANDAGNVSAETVAALRPYLPALIAGLDDPNSDVAHRCAGYLGQFGAEAEASVPRLHKMLVSGTADARLYSAIALRSIAKESVVARAAALDALAASSGRNTYYPAMAIGSPEAIDDERRSALLTLLESPDDSVAGAAAAALGRGRSGDVDVLRAILRQAKSARVNRGWFVSHTTRFGSIAEPFVSRLGGFLCDPDPAVRSNAVRVLSDWAREGVDLSLAQSALEMASHDKSRSLREWAEYAIREWEMREAYRGRDE